MEHRVDFQSISPFLPLKRGQLAVTWPPEVVKTLKSLSKGPSLSNVCSGKLFARTIIKLRDTLGFESPHSSTLPGFSLFFDDLVNKDESKKWFEEVVPRLADFVLRLPALLGRHYKNAGETGLRLLEAQQPGIVVLSQELIAALLSCSLFCLFPTTNRSNKQLGHINFDRIFRFLSDRTKPDLENKIKCLVHYFERVSANMPTGNVSIERKVLPWRNSSSNIVYPNADFWSKSTNPLCRFEAHTSGAIEDQSTEVLEVHFADRSIGGLVLWRGVTQEEICFSISPELIVSILFLPKMEDNESIEMVGAERFSNYTGYNMTFRFSGDHVDNKDVDVMGRRRRRVIAIDALNRPGMTQYESEFLLRETNKAFCGYLLNPNVEGEIGVATGNWGCGVFGGDPELKVVLQWLAASEAKRPFMSYYTFGLEVLEKIGPFAKWVGSHKCSVGEVWSRVVKYSAGTLKGEVKIGLFRWLVTSLGCQRKSIFDMEPKDESPIASNEWDTPDLHYPVVLSFLWYLPSSIAKPQLSASLPVEEEYESGVDEEKEIEDVKFKKKDKRTDKRVPYQRIFSNNEEIAILEALIDCPGKMKIDHEFFKNNIQVDVAKQQQQVQTKVYTFKRKFEDNKDRSHFRNPHDRKVYELSKLIWGNG